MGGTEHKRHKHKHSSSRSKHSHKSKHKHHKSHHHHKHHKKSHKKDNVEVGGDGVDTKALELVMTEHLLNQLEQAGDSDGGSMDSDISSEEEAMSSLPKSPLNCPSTSLNSPPQSVKGPPSGENKTGAQVVNDSEVTSTSCQELSSKPSLFDSTHTKPKNKLIKINIQQESLSTFDDLDKNDSSDQSLKQSSEGKDDHSSITVSAGDSKVTYVNLKTTKDDNNLKTGADLSDSEKSDKDFGRDSKKRSSKHQHKRSVSRSISPHKSKSSKRRRSRSRSMSPQKYHRRARSRSRSRRSHSRSRRSHSRTRRSRSRSRTRYRSDSRRRHSSRSPRQRHSQYRSPRRDRHRHRRYSRSRSRSRSSSREPIKKPLASRSEVVETVSKIAKEFGSIKKAVEINKLTSLCSQLQKKQARENVYGAKKEERTGNNTEHRAPFEVKAAPVRQPVLLFENNAWKTSNQVVLEANATMAIKPVEQVFPVSTGVQHAGVQSSAAKGSNVFDQSQSLPVSDLVVKRLEANRRLQYNPTDYDAHVALAMIDQQTAAWAQSKLKPGQFTGQQKLNPLSTEAHKSGFQTWAKKRMFHDLAPVIGGFGLKMLKKMGWKEGEPLGTHGQGQLEPLALDVKTDRSGLKSSSDGGSSVVPVAPAQGKFKITASQIAQSKHPVSALQEICQKRHWNSPQYTLIGPTDNTAFLYKVTIPIGTYQPISGSNIKKEAKSNAAAAALHGLGLTEKTVEYMYTAL